MFVTRDIKLFTYIDGMIRISFLYPLKFPVALLKEWDRQMGP